MSALEIVAVVISVLGIWLTARRALLCWPVSLLACALYFKLFLDVRLYADMGLQVLFGLSILYGWLTWARKKGDDGKVTPEVLPWKTALAGLTMGAVGAVVIGWATSHYTDASLPWIDATLSSFSLVAQVWTARRHTASWLLWMVVNVLYVGMFIVKALWLTAGLYAVLLGLAMLGYRRWRQAL
jgi:nicotinamide mononucleotide transporter